MIADPNTPPPQGQARLDIPLDRPGRTVGALRIPHSDHRSAYGQIVVPVVVIQGGPGPTALLTAGIHGDEYEGQIALLRLARDLDPASLNGRAILVPCAHPAAAQAGSRTSPLDGGNLARLFPGDPGGGPTQQIAEGIARLLLPEANFLVDCHSGGSSLDYVPCGWGRLPHDAMLAGRVLDLLIAFAAPLTALVRRPDAGGTLIACALERSIPAMATELGGGGGVTRDTAALAEAGIRRVLAAMGLIAGTGQPAPPTRLLAVEPAHFVRAPGDGLFEPLYGFGQEVNAGSVAGRLWDLQRPAQVPLDLRFEAGGLAICRRVPAMAQVGDVLVHLAADVTRADLLSR